MGDHAPKLHGGAKAEATPTRAPRKRAKTEPVKPAVEEPQPEPAPAPEHAPGES